MTNWRVAIETSDPDPAGRPVPIEVIGHAYDIDAGKPAHPVAGNYKVVADRKWMSSFLPWPRCAECTKKVGRRP